MGKILFDTADISRDISERDINRIDAIKEKEKKSHIIACRLIRFWFKFFTTL